MPRQARKKSESGIYHVMLRGINQQQIFEDTEDCDKFIHKDREPSPVYPGRMVEEKDMFLYEILNEFHTLGEELLFSELLIKKEKDITNVYLLRDASYKYALQLEIDWRECDIFMYIVYLKNGNIPSSNDIYVYTDGTWCRKYIEEIYSIKNPIYKEKQSLRYTKDFIKYKLNFYYDLIKTHPDKLPISCTKTQGDGSVIDNSNR